MRNVAQKAAIFFGYFFEKTSLQSPKVAQMSKCCPIWSHAGYVLQPAPCQGPLMAADLKSEQHQTAWNKSKPVSSRYNQTGRQSELKWSLCEAAIVYHIGIKRQCLLHGGRTHVQEVVSSNLAGLAFFLFPLFSTFQKCAIKQVPQRGSTLLIFHQGCLPVQLGANQPIWMELVKRLLLLSYTIRKSSNPMKKHPMIFWVQGI